MGINALDDAKELADIYAKAGFIEVEAKAGVHHGTFKVFVNYIPVADISQLDREITIWNALEQLNTLVDVSDPDMEHPNIYHAIQTAERLREDNQPEWLQVVGLIHDLGKIMYLRGSDDEGTGREKQWAMVGDTFIVGSKLPDGLIFPEFNILNPDMNPFYQLHHE